MLKIINKLLLFMYYFYFTCIIGITAVIYKV